MLNTALEEPSIPISAQRVLGALWISLGLHGAFVALVQVRPALPAAGSTTLEVRLDHTPRAAHPELKPVPLLVPSLSTEAIPVIAEAAAPLPVITPSEPEPAPEPQPVADTPAPTPALAISSAVDLTFYAARDVDVHPRALRNIEPAYPEAAERLRQSGTVRLQLKLEADGSVSDIEVVSADPPELFESSALDAFRDARFAPAQRQGRPVRALVLIEVVYDWEGRQP